MAAYTFHAGYAGHISQGGISPTQRRPAPSSQKWASLRFAAPAGGCPIYELSLNCTLFTKLSGELGVRESTVGPRIHMTTVPWDHVTMVPRHHGTMRPRYRGASPASDQKQGPRAPAHRLLVQAALDRAACKQTGSPRRLAWVQNVVWANHDPLPQGWIRCWSRTYDCEYDARLENNFTTFEISEVE